MAHSPRILRRSNLIVFSLLLAILAGIGTHSLFTPGYGAQLGARELRLSNNAPSGLSTYRLSFSLPAAGTLGSVRAQFCANDPFPGEPCTTPAGLNVDAVTLNSQTGPGGFTVSGASTANEVLLTRTPGAAAAGPLSFELANATNPSSPGSYYVRLTTYATNNGTGTANHDGGLAFAIVNNVTLTATIPPFLIFCTGVTIANNNCANAQGNYVDFGELSNTTARNGTSQMLVATNAVDGYNITVQGTTLTSGINEIGAMSGDVSRPGTAQFGFNLRANGTPSVGKDPSGPGTGIPMPGYNTPNSYRLVSGDMIVSNTKPDDLRLYTASYISNVPRTQAPGVYVSTLTYICLASF